MLNQVILVGKIHEVDKHQDGSASVKLIVDNEETMIAVYLSKDMSTHVDHVTIGSILGTKAKMKYVDNEIVIYAEKITFIKGDTK